ncbi:MAG TPA: chorismate-binding protein, partial [Candidatus Deferrimicrobiaceae bacterium]|nr:chorismate-binding protein [Candidatus Deferrimicrobiaceae bacterium]
MTIQPERGVFLAQAAPGVVIPVWQEFHADLETPVSAYLKIADRFPDNHFLLESVEGGEKWARYSFIGFDPYLIFRADRSSVTITKGTESEVRGGTGDPMKELEGILAGIRYVRAEGLPRLSGGAVGFLGYDYVRHIERIPDTHSPEGTPDALFLFPTRLVIFDNVKHTIRIVAHGQIGGERPLDDDYDRCVRSIEEVKEVLKGPLPWTDIPAGEENDPPVFEVPREIFLAAVRKAKEYIRDGEIIQAVLSNRARVRTKRSPSEVYRVLRSQNPSPYMFLLKLGDLALVGSSPEILVRLEGNLIQLRPIAGTRPRGATTEEDRRMEAELLSDPKELAEHVMLVDLGRNDVGRVAEVGSVRVTEFQTIERYSHVMHIVSNVRGRIREDADAISLLRATFPAGTLSGAPKVR